MKRLNADPAELAQFDAHAKDWWDTDGPFAPLHAINPLRLDFIHRHCHSLKQRTVLDVGCGGGLLSEAMAATGALVTGIDLAEESLTVAKQHAQTNQHAIDYRCIATEALAEQAPAQWEIVTCMEMLEHVPNPGSVVKACGDLVQPGGKVFFSTLNRTRQAWLYAIVGAEYLLNLLPRGTHDAAAFITPAELDGWARSAGLRLCGMTGLHYNPISRQYALGDGVNVNYLCAYEKGTDS